MWTPSRPTTASAGSQTRWRKFECESGVPVEVVKTSATDEGEPGQVLTQIGHDQVGEVHVPHACRDLGGPNEWPAWW